MANNDQTQLKKNTIAQDLLKGALQNLAGKDAVSKLAQKIDHANDNGGIITIGMPSITQNFKSYSTGSDVTKAIQKGC